MAGIEVGMQNAPGPGHERLGPPAGEPAGEAGDRPGAVGGASADRTPAERQPGPRAPRRVTIALFVALFLVVVMTGVLGAVAVLMTRNPDAPPLSRTPVRRLHTPVHFAPVTGVRAAPCPGADAVVDDANTTCYQLDPGVTVTTVQKIEEVPESDGTYSIRLVLSPSNREQIAELIRETVQQQLAIVVQEKVVAAPRVAQEITQDSLSIAGFDKERADALLALLAGPGASPGAPGGGVGGQTGAPPGTESPNPVAPAQTAPAYPTNPVQTALVPTDPAQNHSAETGAARPGTAGVAGR